MFLGFKGNAVPVELMADGSCHRLQSRSPSLAVSESAGSMARWEQVYEVMQLVLNPSILPVHICRFFWGLVPWGEWLERT